MKKNNHSFQWNKVTTLSKYLAMTLFVALPFIGFEAGMKYQAKLTVSPANSLASTQSEPRMVVDKLIKALSEKTTLREQVIMPKTIKSEGGDTFEWKGVSGKITEIPVSFLESTKVIDTSNYHLMPEVVKVIKEEIAPYLATKGYKLNKSNTQELNQAYTYVFTKDTKAYVFEIGKGSGLIDAGLNQIKDNEYYYTYITTQYFSTYD